MNIDIPSVWKWYAEVQNLIWGQPLNGVGPLAQCVNRGQADGCEGEREVIANDSVQLRWQIRWPISYLVPRLSTLCP